MGEIERLDEKKLRQSFPTLPIESRDESAKSQCLREDALSYKQSVKMAAAIAGKRSRSA
jgi:hypothetical protein